MMWCTCNEMSTLGFPAGSVVLPAAAATIWMVHCRTFEVTERLVEHLMKKVSMSTLETSLAVLACVAAVEDELPTLPPTAPLAASPADAHTGGRVATTLVLMLGLSDAMREALVTASSGVMHV
jgi:hypothetical protein